MEVFLWWNVENMRETFTQMSHMGQRLFLHVEERRINDAEYLDSLRFNTEKLLRLQSVKRIILVGSSGVGKSTLQQITQSALQQDQELGGKMSLPKRVITRDPRDDDSDEVVHKTPEEFSGMVDRGELGLYGVKFMEKGRKEGYGYLKPEEGKIPIYFANNGVLKNPETVKPEDIFEDALIINIYAPDIVRVERVRRRSPQLIQKNPDEFAFRFSEEERSARLIDKSHITIKNFGRYEKRSSTDLLQLIQLVTQM